MLYYKRKSRVGGNGEITPAGFYLSNGSHVPDSEANRDYIDLHERIAAGTAQLLAPEDPEWPEDAELPRPPQQQRRGRGGVPIP